MDRRTQSDGDKTTQPPKFALEQEVRCTLFDGHIKDRRGCVMGSALNSDGEVVYLVEMLDPPKPGEDYGRQEGTAQLEHKKKWVLSLYEGEMTAA